jgi:hypothetical protein
MEAHAVQLVVPMAISNTYSLEQQKWLKSMSEFIEIVQSK